MGHQISQTIQKKSVQNTFFRCIARSLLKTAFWDGQKWLIGNLLDFILLGWHVLCYRYHITNKYVANIVWYRYLTNRLLWKQLVWASQLNLESIISCKRQNKNIFLIQLADNAIWLELATTTHYKRSNGYLYLKAITQDTSIQSTSQTTHAPKALSCDIMSSNPQDFVILLFYPDTPEF